MKDTKEKERVLVGTVVDEYGVILNHIYEGDKIVTPAQDEYKHKYSINFKKGDAFVKVFTNPIIEVCKELSNSEGKAVLTLLSFISYKDGILRYNNKIVTVKDMADILEENYDAYKRNIAKLFKHDIIRKITRPSDTYANQTKQCIVVNPYIFLRGQDVEKDIVELFSGSKWAKL